MLSEELRNLEMWVRARMRLINPLSGELIVARLAELAEEAERLEANTRLTGEEVAERIALEGLPR